MRNYRKEFQTFLPLDGKLIGEVKLSLIIKADKDGDIHSWDIDDVTPVAPFSNVGLVNWAYENPKSLEEVITPIVDSFNDEIKEMYQDDEFEEQREHDAMQETYKSLNRQFIHP